MVHIDSGILLSHKKNEILSFAIAWIGLEIITLSEVSQRQILHDLTCLWNLKNNMTEFI